MTKLEGRPLGLNRGFLTHMKLWQKFALLGAFALAAVLLPTYAFYNDSQGKKDFTAEELGGIEPARLTGELLQQVQQHRSLAALVLSANEGQSQLRSAKQAEVERTMAALDAAIARLPGAAQDKALAAEWVSLKQAWSHSAAEVATRSGDARRNFDSHGAVAARIERFLETLGDHTKLTLDPFDHTYFLVQATLIHLPVLTERLGQLHALGAARLADAARLRGGASAADSGITLGDRQKIDSLIEETHHVSAALARFVEKAIAAKPTLKPQIEADLRAAREGAQQLAQLARTEVGEAKPLRHDSMAYSKAFSDGIDAQFKFATRLSQVLEQELQDVLARETRDQRNSLLAIFGLFALSAALAVLTVRNITGSVNALGESVQHIRQGSYAELQAIASTDELGALSRAFVEMGHTQDELQRQQVAARVSSEADAQRAEGENERLNNSVISILEAVNQLAQRDLTARAPVTQDIIGTVSDSINALTDETSKVLHGVTQIAGQVEAVSGKLKAQAEQVSRAAADERVSLNEMAASLGESDKAMTQVASSAEQSNRSAEQATQATDTALETVNDTVKGMEAIRETIAETEKRIKRLGERSQEITGIVNLINTIAERTHVLALNASMQAAVAGEAGRGFAVVAEEVQRLAESSRNATQQIGTLVSNIQLETNETISTVNRTIGQVVQGSEQAQKAGAQMRRTQQITGQLVAQVQRIAVSSEQQRLVSAQLLKAVHSISQGTERTAAQIKVQNQDTDALVLSARQLVDSVGVFKLPRMA